MVCIISHGTEEAVGVFVGDPLEFRRRDAEDFGGFFQHLADVRARRDTRPYHGIGFVRARRDTRPYHSIGLNKKPVEGNLLDELAVVHGVVVQDCRPNGDKATQLDDFWNEPIRARKPMKKE